MLKSLTSRLWEFDKNSPCSQKSSQWTSQNWSPLNPDLVYEQQLSCSRVSANAATFKEEQQLKIWLWLGNLDEGI